MSDASTPFVETIRIQSFGCARDVAIELTRLHALIGPNDSGKSTVLAALRTACELIRRSEAQLAGSLDPRVVPGTEIAMSWGTTTTAWIRHQRGWQIHFSRSGDAPIDEWLNTPVASAMHDIDPVRGARLIRWDPDAIRRPCDLIPEGSVLAMTERGEGLPAIYDAILSRDRAAFDQIEQGTRRHFPTVKAIWLPTLQRSTKALGVTLVDGTRVHADQLSEGMLYWLAFAALPYIDPTAILLIEEPENGLHPSRIAEVMQVLREVSGRMQVIVATHSPLVVNELQPDEVTILTRDGKAGTRATRLDRTKHFAQRQQVYAPGELWLSFADGLDEAALVDGGDPEPSAG